MGTGTDKLRSNARCSNVIEIDSDSAGGSDDDLPDIQSLAWMPRRTRSPLGRSRSDIFPSRERAKAPSSSTMTAQPNNGKRTRRTAIERETEKETKRHERQAVKEAKLREKERAAALVEVNKMRTDKKVSTPEMIVDLPSTLDVSIRTHVETLLEALSVEHSTWDSPHNAIKWRRKVTSRFNEDADHWEPIPRRIMGERHAAVIVPAAEFVRMAIDGRVGAHATQVQEAFPDHQIIYLLEGLASWTRKNRNLRNRQFTSGVRAREEQQKQQQQQQTGGNWRRRNGTASTEAAVVVPDYVVEDALLELQVMHDVLIHHTAMALETAQWLAVLTQHISTIPYRKQRDRAMYGAAFCMESGQVKTGDDASSTYICMLQEIARVTAPIAHGIAVEFGSVTDLVRGLETGGPGRLEGVRKTINNEGQLSDRTIGQAVSRRMYKVFTGRDETSTDI
ncbi:crossover junction endonuclease EME1 [Geosmithia morbida]|uniref:Crossover junction endonuclease EME1 n=1 Tax=Geosmithia morbida TaxID=1094350 RepID=A0A9P4YRA0_9HYPO|nr:crossover junction endonuclease EME1 [Geosmithia morbida]KAF4119579.1 crossover junction endonuclease EME1 [Geosmithia morbida]